MQNSVKPTLENEWFVAGLPNWYPWKVPNNIKFWFASTTNTPKKKPTEKDVGNLFRTNVPSTPSTKWTIPVHTEATTNAFEPPCDCKLITVVRCVEKEVVRKRGGERDKEENTDEIIFSF